MDDVVGVWVWDEEEGEANTFSRGVWGGGCGGRGEGRTCHAGGCLPHRDPHHKEEDKAEDDV